MASHSPATSDVTALIRDVIDEHYPDLAEAEVRISAFFAWPGKDGGPAVKLHGYPCAAVVKINANPKARMDGLPDATITIDGPDWAGVWDDDQKRALIDHELHHVLVVRDKKTGEIKSDDAGRPKLAMKLHDWTLGGFDAIAKRHGKAAFEVQSVRTLREDRGQLFWSWGDDSAPADEAPAVRLSAASAG
jgi:hypothetical protein